ncbi:hypothetical protein M433DRAFT_297562 [Acidomyces richmondensis BFW]|nr:MAG: hypothetical protein FE78DRAFT_153297 [Acidomyces sp. 'richmondensis']KYG49486.1 hypothetical protein M433DRAFT_297562 [Acidomyces richmondensis BFW]
MSASPPHSPDTSAIRRVAAHALQSKSVAVEKLSAYLYRTYRLTTSSKGFFYILRSQPSHHYKLLRHEADRLETEAYALQILSGRVDFITARLIEHQATRIQIGSCYLISGPFSGQILSDVEPQLSSQALASIDKSLGQYVRRLSALTGPAFGALRHSQGYSGASSWARAFASMLETVLRDGEDALINLPYEGMRELVRRHRSSLDKITQPRLVLLELCSDDNVVVDTKSYKVAGLLDFSTAFWGDPFMSDCFYKPTASFAEGFGRLPNGDADERIRQYMYVMYHSLLAVVRQRYRPVNDNEELAGRRDLTTAMRQLSAVGGSR